MIKWKINKHLYSHSEKSLQAEINNRLDLWDFAYIGYNHWHEKIEEDSTRIMLEIRFRYLEKVND